MGGRKREDSKRTYSARRDRTNFTELRRLALLEPTPEGVERPHTRGDCLEGGSNAERPCPFVSCRYHLALDVQRNGSLTVNFPGLELEQLAATSSAQVSRSRTSPSE